MSVPRPHQAPGPLPAVVPPAPDPAPPRSRAAQILLTPVPVLSAGFLCFVPFLYLALARRRRRDWLMFGGYLSLAVLLVVIVSVATGSASALAGFCIFLVAGLAATHSFVALKPRRSSAPGGRPGQAAALHAARARIHQRAQARKLASEDPGLARELKIGRPDLPRAYDDGGLVDVNAVPGNVLAQCLNLSPAEADAVVAARAQLGRFTSLAELTTYASLRPDRLDNLSDLIIFG